MTQPSKQHRYSLAEIDRMRAAEMSLLSPNVWVSRSAGHRLPRNEADLDRKIEDRIRTYMSAGVRAEELEAAVVRKDELEEQQRMSFPATMQLYR